VALAEAEEKGVFGGWKTFEQRILLRRRPGLMSRKLGNGIVTTIKPV
jgi:hypothetical protein